MRQLSDGTTVRGDIHKIDKVDDDRKMAIRMCVKKVRMEDLVKDDVEYLAHGIITTNSPNVKFQANRRGFRKQQDSIYMELESKLKKWMADNDFRKPEKGKEEKLKGEKTIKQITGESILKLAKDDRYKDILLRLAGSFAKLGVPGKGKGIGAEGVGEEWQDYAKNQMPILTPEKQRGKFIRRHGPPSTESPDDTKERKDKNKDKEPKMHVGHAPGGFGTWQEPVAKLDSEGESTIMPNIPPVSAPIEFPYPVSQIIEDKNSLKWKLNLRNVTGNRIARPQKSRDPFLTKACFNKAFTDYIAKREAWSWEQATELWEFLQAEETSHKTT